MSKELQPRAPAAGTCSGSVHLRIFSNIVLLYVL